MQFLKVPENDDSSKKGFCSGLSNSTMTSIFLPKCESKMEKCTNTLFNTQNSFQKGQKEKRKKDHQLQIDNDNSSIKDYSEAMKRHNIFMKIKLSKFVQGNKNDIERKQREGHLKKQRDIIIMKRNEMRKKRAYEEDSQSVSLHHVPPMRMNSLKQQHSSKLKEKNTKVSLSSNIVRLIQGSD